MSASRSRIEIRVTERQVFAGGASFGESGAYERIKGRAHMAVDPKSPDVAGVVDLDKAPRDAAGLVHFATDLLILKPVDPSLDLRAINKLHAAASF